MILLFIVNIGKHFRDLFQTFNDVGQTRLKSHQTISTKFCDMTFFIQNHLDSLLGY